MLKWNIYKIRRSINITTENIRLRVLLNPPCPSYVRIGDTLQQYTYFWFVNKQLLGPSRKSGIRRFFADFELFYKYFPRKGTLVTGSMEQVALEEQQGTRSTVHAIMNVSLRKECARMTLFKFYQSLLLFVYRKWRFKTEHYIIF